MRHKTDKFTIMNAYTIDSDPTLALGDGDGRVDAAGLLNTEFAKTRKKERFTFTKAQRRELCAHEAAHAVTAALGGIVVYRLAVAPEGNDGSWTFRTRSGRVLEDLLGICDTLNMWLLRCSVEWVSADTIGYSTGGFKADREVFNELISDTEAYQVKRGGRPGYSSLMRRRVRAEICCAVAGEIAEQIHRGEEVRIECPEDFGVGSELAFAEACSFLLPYRNEYEHACRITEAALRRPEIWECVLRLADELERIGDMDGDALAPFLPPCSPRWPSAPRLPGRFPPPGSTTKWRIAK